MANFVGVVFYPPAANAASAFSGVLLIGRACLLDEKKKKKSFHSLVLKNAFSWYDTIQV